MIALPSEHQCSKVSQIHSPSINLFLPNFLPRLISYSKSFPNYFPFSRCNPQFLIYHQPPCDGGNTEVSSILRPVWNKPPKHLSQRQPLPYGQAKAPLILSHHFFVLFPFSLLLLFSLLDSLLPSPKAPSNHSHCFSHHISIAAYLSFAPGSMLPLSLTASQGNVLVSFHTSFYFK